MRFVVMLAMLGLMRLVPGAAPYVMVGMTTLILLLSLWREDQAEKRIKELERELGYVTRSRKSVGSLLKGFARS